ncbi:MAG: SRPBCC domain-containing protein, partial [Pseudolysinimonas sp.]
GADGAPLFALHVVVSIDSSPTAGTELQIDLTASSPTPDAAPALAGLEPGWNQLLDRLHALLVSEPS